MGLEAEGERSSETLTVPSGGSIKVRPTAVVALHGLHAAVEELVRQQTRAPTENAGSNPRSARART